MRLAALLASSVLCSDLYAASVNPDSVLAPRATQVESGTSVVGSNERRWVEVRGERLGRVAAARLRSEGVEATLRHPDRLRVAGSDRLTLAATFGTEASVWTLELAGEDLRYGSPFTFHVVPPRPAITAAVVMASGSDLTEYELNVFGDGFTAYSEVLVDGVPIPTEPIPSSPYATALTVGLKGTVVGDVLREGRTRRIRVETPGPGGGVSKPFTLIVNPVPLWRRLSLWVGVLMSTVVLGGIGHALRVRRDRRIRDAAVRQSIADDLHDDVGSRLSGLALALDVSSMTLPEEARGEVQVRAEEARALLSDLRDTVWVVDGSERTLRDLVERVRVSAETLLPEARVEVHAEGDLGREVPIGVRRHLLMLCKEAIHNASRHADPELISLAVSVGRDGTTTVSIADDGCGFELAEGGRGMGTLRRRAEAIGGALRVESSPDDGTTVSVAFEL